MQKIVCLVSVLGFAWLCVTAEDDLHHHYIKPLPTEAQIVARENNDKILYIFGK